MLLGERLEKMLSAVAHFLQGNHRWCEIDVEEDQLLHTHQQGLRVNSES